MIDLKFNHVSKRYRVLQETADDAARNPLMRKIKSLWHPSQDFWALRDVDFVVNRGEAVGLIGHNGAGKSTILKLLASITTPTSGEITINGRLSALIEVGSGFHPELTGRENIYLNGAILGMRRREISAKLDSIVEFAGIRQFLDTPVKRFSSGMYVRLGFSIAAHLDPDILLLDEVLAVGDAAFQAKCLQRINELQQAGTTIVFISHDLGAVERICSRVILMNRGEIAANGTPRDVIAQYQSAGTKFAPSARLNIKGWAPGKARVTSLAFLDAERREVTAFRTGEPLIARIGYTSEEIVPATVIEVFFYAQDGEMRCQLTSETSGGRIDLEAGTGTVEFYCSELCLQQGIYNIDISIEENDWQHQCATLRVDPGKVVSHGTFYMPHVLRLIKNNGVSTHNSTDGTSIDRSLDDLGAQV